MILPKDLMKEDMETVPFVNWDRFVPNEAENKLDLYGWIPRDDGKADFVLLEYKNTHDNRWTTNFSTSSAKYSAEIHKLLKMRDGSHVDCVRVEDHFPDVKNVIRLK